MIELKNKSDFEEYKYFIEEIRQAFFRDNVISNPSTPEEIFKLHKNVKYYKTHINQYKFDVKLETLKPEMELITNCILLMRYNTKNKRYYIEMYISEEASVDDKFYFKKNYEYVKSIMITKNEEQAYNLIKDGIPIWPDRNKTDYLYPNIMYIVPEKEENSKDINEEEKDKMDKELIELFEKDKIERDRIKKIKKDKRLEEKKRLEEREYIKRYGKFNRDEALEYLINNWNKNEL